ncbi:MAG: hypothetical protein LBD22_04210 [Spirochaetaceae bacterium]|jgi:hypothetical protein|nr:hypothetical protein [Spirochaetaceae bacterium]
MKKLVILSIIAGLSFTTLSAQDAAKTDGAAKKAEPEKTEKSEESEKKSKFKLPSFISTEGADLSTGYRRQRLFEIGFAETQLGLSNSWFAFGEVLDLFTGFSEDFNINQFLSKGELAVETAIYSKPVSAKFRIGSLFTMDLGIGMEANLFFNTSKATIDSLSSMLNLTKLDRNDTTALANAFNSLNVQGDFYAAGSAFMFLNIGAEKSFLNKKLLVRAAPSVYVPVFYMPQTDVHLNTDRSDPAWLSLIGKESAGAWLFSSENMTAGMDLSLETRYAVWPILDAGATIDNIPMVPATMRNKKTYEIDIDYQLPNIPYILDNQGMYPDLMDKLDDISMKFDFNETNSANTPRKVLRPTRLGFYAIIKPFKSRFLLIRPDLGCSLNTAADFSYFNWGLRGELNLPVLSVSGGTRLFESVWSQYITLVLDTRIFEFSLGVALRGPTFVSSWTARGVGLSLGFKFGF